MQVYNDFHTFADVEKLLLEIFEIIFTPFDYLNFFYTPFHSTSRRMPT